MIEHCKTCKAFQPAVKHGRDAKDGSCRRKSPQMLSTYRNVGQYCTWPEVDINDWCMEYIPNDE